MEYTNQDINTIRKLSVDRLQMMGLLAAQAGKGKVRIIKVFDENSIKMKYGKVLSSKEHVKDWKFIFKIDGLPDETPNKELIESVDYTIMDIKPFGLIQLMVKKPFIRTGSDVAVHALDLSTGEYKLSRKVAYYRGVVIDNKGNIVAENISTYPNMIEETIVYNDYFIESIEEQKGKIIDHIIKYGMDEDDTGVYSKGYYPTIFPEIVVDNWENYQIANFGFQYYSNFESDFVIFNKDTKKMETYGKRTAALAQGSQPVWIAVAEDSIVALDLFRERVYIEKKEIPKNSRTIDGNYTRGLLLTRDIRNEFETKGKELGK